LPHVANEEQKLRAVSNASWEFRISALFVCGLLVCGGVLFPRSGKTAASLKQQSPFQTYTLDTGAGTYGADISPDSKLVAVDAVNGSEGPKGIESVEEIQVWSFRDRKLVTSKVLSRRTYAKVSDVPNDYDPGFVRYTASGSKLVVYWKGHVAPEGRLLVLDSKTLDELQNIDLGMSSWPRPTSASDLHSHVIDVQVDERGDRAAVLLSWGLGGGELRIYSLASGDLIRKRDFQVTVEGISLDSTGRKVATLFMPFSPGERLLHVKERNLLVLDVDSGKTVTEINTGYIASSVAFVGSNMLATASANPEPKYFSKDTLKIWNAQTGQLVREIVSPPGGVHNTLLVTSDGRVALGYVGLDKERLHWWLGQEEYVETIYKRFRLWDLVTGQVIATSSDLPSLTGSAFALSAKGDVVLIYPIAAGGPLQFYEVR
jgi:hypothetical protein